MNWMKRPGGELIAIFLMVAVVSILATFQYRWTAEISAAEQARLKLSLATSVRNFDQEYSYDFQRLCESFEIDPEADSSSLESRVSRAYLNWSNSNQHPDFVASVSILKTDSVNAAHLETFDSSDNRIRSIAWPDKFESLHKYLSQQSQQASLITDDRQAAYYPWTVFEEAPALVRPLFQTSSAVKGAEPEVHLIGFLIVKLNQTYLERQYIPDLVARHFGAAGQRSFAVTIRSAKAPYQSIYVSDPNVAISNTSPDAAVNLFDLVGEASKRRGHAPLQASDASKQWQLVVQHPAGSLEEAVSGWRRRNLVISLGLLAVLAVSMALIFSTARRSKALAKMQMEFVAGVSHELCTPLAVINSAAENLADGVVDNTEQMQEYGGLIRGQGRRLERLVDGVLLFTAGRFGLSGYDLAPLDVEPLIAQSLVTAGPALRDEGFTLEKEIASDLPPILADSSAVITCIENLLSNAMKYSNTSRWIGIRARECPERVDAKFEVQIAVEDKGMGIPPDDLPHIFEPFYRVQSVRDNQIRGVGLGLHLVKRMMEDMGGQVSVTSELGQGTTVTLYFPTAEPAAGKNSETN